MLDLKKDTAAAVFDPELLGGSLKHKIVNPDLARERERCTFDRAEAYNVLISEEARE